MVSGPQTSGPEPGSIWRSFLQSASSAQKIEEGLLVVNKFK